MTTTLQKNINDLILQAKTKKEESKELIKTNEELEKRVIFRNFY